MKQSSQDFFENDSERNDFYISIPVIVIAAVFILWQWGRSEDPESPALSTISEVEEDRSLNTGSVTQSNVIAPSQIILEQSNQNTTPFIPTKSPKIITKSEAVMNTLPQRTPVPEEAEVLNSDPLANDTEVPSPELSNAEILQGETVKQSDEKVVELSATEVETSEELSTSASSLDCSIAVGLYREDKNLRKMYDRLVQNGYSAITAPLKYSTKVAVKIPCNKESSQRILREIRSEYAPDAFIE